MNIRIRSLVEIPCARCKKTHYSIGKYTIYGPVCNACSPYFRVKKPCGICGELSSRLSRVKRLGIDVPVCQKCARRDFGTCSMCHRYRRLVQSNEGEFLCRKCNEQGMIPCGVCGERMAAGIGKQCQICSLKKLLDKRIRINSTAFYETEIRGLYLQFCEWLPMVIGWKKAALSVNKYLSFFLDIDQTFKKMPDYISLVQYFGAEGLRRVRLPMKWLILSNRIIIDQKIKEEDSVERQIISKLESILIGSKEQQMLAEYYQQMYKKYERGEMNLRSIYLSLVSAAAFLKKNIELHNELPSQIVLNCYLTEKPGQRASISSFINFLSDSRSIKLHIPEKHKNEYLCKQKKMLKKKIINMLKNQSNTKLFKQKWIVLCLAYFHGLSFKYGKLVKSDELTLENDGFFVMFQDTKYWIPYEKSFMLEYK